MKRLFLAAMACLGPDQTLRHHRHAQGHPRDDRKPMAEISNPQQQIEQIRRWQLRPLAGTATAAPVGHARHTERHDRQRPVQRCGATQSAGKQIGPGHHGQGVLQQEETSQIAALGEGQACGEQPWPVIKKTLKTTLAQRCLCFQSAGTDSTASSRTGGSQRMPTRAFSSSSGNSDPDRR